VAVGDSGLDRVGAERRKERRLGPGERNPDTRVSLHPRHVGPRGQLEDEAAASSDRDGVDDEEGPVRNAGLLQPLDQRPLRFGRRREKRVADEPPPVFPVGNGRSSREIGLPGEDDEEVGLAAGLGRPQDPVRDLGEGGRPGGRLSGSGRRGQRRDEDQNGEPQRDGDPRGDEVVHGFLLFGQTGRIKPERPR